MATNQFYHFSIILYAYPTQDLLILLGAEQYAFIEHLYDSYDQLDYDNYLVRHNGNLPKWKIGDPKDLHYHLYVKLYKKKTTGGVFDILNKWVENCTQPFLIENLNNVPKFIRYLTHIDNFYKYQYNVTDIQSNMNLDLYFNIQITDNQFTQSVIKLIESNSLTTFKQIVFYAISQCKLDLVMKRAYFFKSLL